MAYGGEKRWAAGRSGRRAGVRGGVRPGARGRRIPAAARRSQGAAVLRHVSVGPLPTTRLAPRERRLRPDHQPRPRVGLGARDRRRSVLAVQHAVSHQRPDQHRLPGRPPPHLPSRILGDAIPPVPPELAPGRRVPPAHQRAARRPDVRGRGAPGLEGDRAVAGVRRRGVPVRPLAGGSRARRAARRAGVPPTGGAGAFRPVRDRAPGGGARRPVGAGPSVAGGVEPRNGARAGRPRGRGKLRLALARAAQGVHGALALRRVLPRSGVIPGPRDRIRAVNHQHSLEDAMLKRSISFVAAALVVALAPVTLRAQSTGRFDNVTVGGAFGGLSGAANLDAAGTADWRLGWAASVDVTKWLQQYVGVRASGSWAQDSLNGASLSGRGKFNKFTYDADVVLRYPIQSGAGTFSPYVLGGVGAISVHQLESDSTWSKFAATSARESSTASGAGVSGRKGVTTCTRSTATASTRRSTTSPGRAASHCRSETGPPFAGRRQHGAGRRRAPTRWDGPLTRAGGWS